MIAFVVLFCRYIACGVPSADGVLAPHCLYCASFSPLTSISKAMLINVAIWATFYSFYFRANLWCHVLLFTDFCVNACLSRASLCFNCFLSTFSFCLHPVRLESFLVSGIVSPMNWLTQIPRLVRSVLAFLLARQLAVRSLRLHPYR